MTNFRMDKNPKYDSRREIKEGFSDTNRYNVFYKDIYDKVSYAKRCHDLAKESPKLTGKEKKYCEQILDVVYKNKEAYGLNEKTVKEVYIELDYSNKELKNIVWLYEYEGNDIMLYIRPNYIECWFAMVDDYNTRCFTFWSGWLDESKEDLLSVINITHIDQSIQTKMEKIKFFESNPKTNRVNESMKKRIEAFLNGVD